MTTVYAKAPYTYVYAQHAVGHKQGKAWPGRRLTVLSTWGSGQWLEIEPLSLDRPSEENYNNYWVNKDHVSFEKPDHGLTPTPEPGEVSFPVEEGEDMELVEVVITRKYLKKP